jgi:hypothetical protein
LTAVVIHSLDPQIAVEMKGEAPDLEVLRPDRAGMASPAAQGEGDHRNDHHWELI